MSLNKIDAPSGVATTNLWVMEIDGVQVASFQGISGLSRGIGSVNATDGGTGITYNFSDQKPTFGDLTLTRRRDPNAASDAKVREWMSEAIASGKKFDGTFTKYHFNGTTVLYRIEFYGLLFQSESYPSFDKGSPGTYDITYSAKVDYWEEV